MTPTPPPRILIVRLSALGDVVHTLPVLGALRAAWPEAHIGWVVEPGGAPLLEGHPMLDALHIVPKQAWRRSKWTALRGPFRDLVGELRAQAYDVSLDVQGLTKSAMWGWASGAARRIGFRGPEAREASPWLNNERIRPPAESLHVIERNLALLGALEIDPPDPIVTPVHLSSEAVRRAEAIVAELVPNDRPLAVVTPGAGWATKQWAPERFGELTRRLVERFDARVAVAWGPGEEALTAAVIESANVGDEVVALPPTTFVELGAVAARARLFVGGDTGPTHLAAALGVATVSMMGPLDARRNGPYGPHCVTIQHGVPRRAPRWRNHRRWCDPRTDLRHVGVDEVFAACERAMASS